MIVFAHLSDTRLNAGKDRAERAAAVVAYLNRMAVPLEVVLVTGDIAETFAGRPVRRACSPDRASARAAGTR